MKLKKTAFAATAAVALALGGCSGSGDSAVFSQEELDAMTNEEIFAEYDALRPDEEGIAQLETDCVGGDLQACDNLLFWTDDLTLKEIARDCGGHEPAEDALIYCTANGPEVLNNPLYAKMLQRVDEENPDV